MVLGQGPQVLLVAPGQFKVIANRLSEGLDLLGRQGLFDDRRRPGHELIGPNHLAFLDNRTGCNDGALPDVGAIEHDRIDGDQAIIFNNTPMDNRIVAHTDIVTDYERRTVVRV